MYFQVWLTLNCVSQKQKENVKEDSKLFNLNQTRIFKAAIELRLLS